jgi:hypothetical protein
METAGNTVSEIVPRLARNLMHALRAPLPLSVFWWARLMRRPLARFGFWPRCVRPHLGRVLRMLRRHRMLRCRRHGLYPSPLGWWISSNSICVRMTGLRIPRAE